MKTGTLAIFDVDSNYANSLMEYISDKRGIPFQTIAFTEKEALIEYAKKRKVELLLISVEAMEEKIAELDFGKIVLLSDGRVFTEYIGYTSLYKYQSSENIIREVMNYYIDIEKDENSVSIPMNDVEIIGVYSPVGRIGKTTFALTLGQIISQEKSTLYINMEEFSAFRRIFKKEYAGDLSDLMYFYKQTPESVPLKIQAIIENIRDLNYIPPMIYSEDLRNVDSKDWIGLIRTIAGAGIYGTIIIDLSNMVKDVFEILDLCMTIYMPIGDGSISEMKVSEFEEFMLKTDREQLLNKFIKIRLPNVNDIDMEQYFERQIWGNMGDCVKDILERPVV